MRLAHSAIRVAALCALTVLCVVRGASAASMQADARAVGILTGSEEPEEPVWVQREIRAMGTRLRIRVEALDRAAGIRATEAAFDTVRSVESLLSTWHGDTELSRLNGAPVGQAVSLSPGLARILEEVRVWSRETRGAFEPVVGALVDAWDLRGQGRHPSPETLARAVAATGPRALTLSSKGATAVRRDSLAWIDAGAFGKGHALRKASRALKQAGITRGILDFGGQIVTLGRPSSAVDGASGESWRVSVAHPSRRNRPVTDLALEGRASVSTTGGSERFVAPEGRRLSHVIDPRSGRPIRPWGSVTVVATDPLVADLASTALFVLGPDEALAWAADREDLAVLVLTASEGSGAEEGRTGPSPVRARWTPALEAYLVDGTVRTGGSAPASPADRRPAGPR